MQDKVRKINLSALFVKEKAIQNFLDIMCDAWRAGMKTVKDEQKILVMKILTIIDEELIKNHMNLGQKVFQLLQILNTIELEIDG